MSDLIDRQAAIDVLAEMQGQCTTKAALTQNSKIWKQIKKLPAAEPERKKGKWQITDAYPHNVYCPECHAKFAQTNWAVWEDGSLPRNFCPNCGSYNGGE